MIVLRRHLGDELRRQRLRQQRTLREISRSARVSLGYLSEVERGQKEPSSELLSSICGALEVPLSQVLRNVSDDVALAELAADVSPTAPGATPGGPGPRRPGRAQPGRPAATDVVAAA